MALLFAICSSVAYSQDKKTTKANLDEATVFFQGAELIHSAAYSVTKGENEIYIEGLSPNIDKNSLKIRTTNNVIVSAYEFSVDYLAGSKGKNTVAKKLQDSINYYEKRLGEIETEIAINQDMIKFLKKGTGKNVSGSEKGLGIDELVKTMEYYKTQAFELQSTLTASNKKKDETEETISRLKRQLSAESLKNDKSSGVLKLKLAAPVNTNCNFTISYYTIVAAWIPYYDINIASTDQPIKIVAKSRVKQTTGMDWEKVKLTLSSATPSKGKTAPLFDAWFLNYVQPKVSSPQNRVSSIPAQNAYSYDNIPKEVAKEAPLEKEFWIRGISSFNENTKPLYIVDGQIVEDLNSLDAAMVKDFQVLKDASATAIYGSKGANGVVVINLKDGMDDFVTQAETDLNIAYNIDLPYTIPGNGKEQIIDLQTKETSAEYKYYCAPKLDTETYLLAEISDWQKLNLLSGKANITYEGTYVGESQIDASSTQQKLTLTLGSDKRVSVKREKMQDFSSIKFLGNDTKQAFTYKLTVRNSQNKAIKMVLKDQYPISMQKEIEVELLAKETTPWTANKEDLGVITWEEELKAGETKTYQMSYTVKYPKGRKVNL